MVVLRLSELCVTWQSSARQPCALRMRASGWMSANHVPAPPARSRSRTTTLPMGRMIALRSSAVPGGLNLEALRVTPLRGQQLLVGAELGDVPVRDHRDAVGDPHRGEAVR